MAAQNLQIQIIIELDTKIEGKVELILTLTRTGESINAFPENSTAPC
jgi:hypothetical protein